MEATKPTSASAKRSSSSEMSLRASQSEDVGRSLLDPARGHVSALSLGSKVARLAPLRLPTDRRRGRHAKPRCSRTATQPAINRCQKPDAQILRESVSHPCRLPSSARIPNQKFQPTGIPRRFLSVEKRSKFVIFMESLWDSCCGAMAANVQVRCWQYKVRSIPILL